MLRFLARWLYLGSRAAGDANALQRGGAPRLARRLVKRRVHRTEIKWLKKGRLW